MLAVLFDLLSLVDATIKLSGMLSYSEPWWPSVVFPDWEAVERWEIPLPKTISR